MKFGHTFAPTKSKTQKMKFHICDRAVTCSVTLLFLWSVTNCDASISLSYQPMNSNNVDPTGNSNATLSFFFTADPQFGWGTYYSGNEERSNNDN